MSIWHVYDLPEIDEFAGPSEGTVKLPFHLYWTSSSQVFDLSNPGDVWTMYSSVFSEGTKEEIKKYVNKDLFLNCLDSFPLPSEVEKFYGVGYRKHLTNAV